MKATTRTTERVEHLAIVMDGNSRWAEATGLTRDEGHRQGAKNVRTIAEACADRGVKFLTLFAFSTENWNRPKDEVEFLIQLIAETLSNEFTELDEKQTRLQFIGDLTRFPLSIQNQLYESMARTSHHSSLVLTVALNFGGRWDLARAARLIAEQVQEGLLDPDEIDESTFESNLSTYPLPAPDLCIRTGGDHRISNFMLWDLAYTELYFSQDYWPEFSVAELDVALGEYSGRDRRFGSRATSVTI